MIKHLKLPPKLKEKDYKDNLKKGYTDKSLDLYWRKLQTITVRDIEFKPGLNVLVGSCGSGKSTVLDYMASWLAAKEGGYSKVTKDWLYSLYNDDWGEHRGRLLKGFLEHSGEPIMYFSTQRSIGMVGDANWPKDDFFSEAMEQLRYTGSQGQKNIYKLTKFFNLASGKLNFPVEIINRDNENLKSFRGSQTTKEVTDLFFKPTEGVPLGNTLLMDEPDEFFDIKNKMLFMGAVKKLVLEGYQIILVTHNPLFLKLVKDLGDKAQLIEMEKNYIQEVLSYEEFNFHHE